VLLSKALRLEPGTTVAFTGAGGKSAALGRLAEEASPDLPILLTTTTHLGLEQSALAGAHIVLASDDDLGEVPSLLGRVNSLLVTGPRMLEQFRWTSPGDANLARLHALAVASGAVLAVEADGSRGRPLKAPAAHEPLVPNFTNILVPVAGASVFGQPLSAEVVHRPERAADLLGIASGEVLTPGRVARLLGNPAGGLKGYPPGAEVRVLINQVDDAGRLGAASECGQSLLEAEAVHAVMLASLGAGGGVQQTLGRVAGVVLAAGGSRRMGRPKLVEAWKGEPLLRHVVRGAMEAGLTPIVVVLGDGAEALRQTIGDLDVREVVNLDWPSGQSSSMRLGLSAVQTQSEAAVFLLGDMPLVNPRLIRSLVQAHASSLAPIVAPYAEGRPGNPVLFDRGTFSALARVEGDQGGRAIFDQFEMRKIEADAREFFDLDTQEDLEWLEEQE
jgi:molybdenum cofactor cytidylyltransferase